MELLLDLMDSAAEGVQALAWPLFLRLASCSLAPHVLPRVLGVLSRTEEPATALLAHRQPMAPFVMLGAAAWLTMPSIDCDWPPPQGYSYRSVGGGKAGLPSQEAGGAREPPPPPKSGEGVWKRAQLTGPFISCYELCRRRKKVF